VRGLSRYGPLPARRSNSLPIDKPSAKFSKTASPIAGVATFCYEVECDPLETRQRSARRPPASLAASPFGGGALAGAQRASLCDSRLTRRDSRDATREKSRPRRQPFDSSGRRCSARRQLELDHIEPWAAGGDDSPANRSASAVVRATRRSVRTSPANPTCSGAARGSISRKAAACACSSVSGGAVRSMYR
jgi:hypothetical protein